jgi:hypothetical protein
LSFSNIYVPYVIKDCLGSVVLVLLVLVFDFLFAGEFVQTQGVAEVVEGVSLGF